MQACFQDTTPQCTNGSLRCLTGTGGGTGNGQDCSSCASDSDCEGGACRHFTTNPDVNWCTRQCSSDFDCNYPMKCNTGLCMPELDFYCSEDRTQVLKRDACGADYGVVETCTGNNACAKEGNLTACLWACRGTTYNDGYIGCTYLNYDRAQNQCCGVCYYLTLGGSYSDCVTP